MTRMYDLFSYILCMQKETQNRIFKTSPETSLPLSGSHNLSLPFVLSYQSMIAKSKFQTLRALFWSKERSARVSLQQRPAGILWECFGLQVQGFRDFVSALPGLKKYGRHFRFFDLIIVEGFTGMNPLNQELLFFRINTGPSYHDLIEIIHSLFSTKCPFFCVPDWSLNILNLQNCLE